jgi:hypothetical protein
MTPNKDSKKGNTYEEKYSYEGLNQHDQIIVKKNTERLIYTIVCSGQFNDIIDAQDSLVQYKDFLDNNVNKEPFPQIQKSGPKRPTIHFLKKGEKICMMMVNTSEEFLPEGLYIVVDLQDAIENSVELDLISGDNGIKLNNFLELTQAYLDSQEEGGQ